MSPAKKSSAVLAGPAGAYLAPRSGLGAQVNDVLAAGGLFSAASFDASVGNRVALTMPRGVLGTSLRNTEFVPHASRRDNEIVFWPLIEIKKR